MRMPDSGCPACNGPRTGRTKFRARADNLHLPCPGCCRWCTACLKAPAPQMERVVRQIAKAGSAQRARAPQIRKVLRQVAQPGPAQLVAPPQKVLRQVAKTAPAQ